MSTIIDGLPLETPLKIAEVQKNITQDESRQTNPYSQYLIQTLKAQIFRVFSDSGFDSSVNVQNQHEKLVIYIQVYLPPSVLGQTIMVVQYIIDSNYGYFSANSSFLYNEKPLRFEFKHQLLMAFKMISKGLLNSSLHYQITPQNGQIEFIKPRVSFSLPMKKKLMEQCIVSKDGINFVKSSITAMKHIAEIFFQQLICQSTNQNQGKKNFIRGMEKYSCRSSIEPAFDETFGSANYNNIEKNVIEEKKKINKLRTGININWDSFSSDVLFQRSSEIRQFWYDLSTSDEQFFFDEVQLAMLKQKIIPEMMNQPKAQKYIYNTIQLSQSKEIKFQHLAMSGFSHLKVTDVEFWYIFSEKDSPESASMERSGDSSPTKIIKKERRRLLTFKESLGNKNIKARNRIQHQNNILKQLKNEPTLFVPEYFYIKNPHFSVEQHVVMQYLPMCNLKEYISQNKNTISFITKLHMFVMIVQGLKFLKDKRVVHLDLKPANVMITKRLGLKLIDFGESYHPLVCAQNFQPAYSMPYTCPQVYDCQKGHKYCQKSDVFSLAVIMFEIVFQKVPFLSFCPNFIDCFKERKYLRKLYFVPEKIFEYGLQNTNQILVQNIFRCFDIKLENRPCVLWLTVIFKQLLNQIINQEFKEWTDISF